MKKYKAFISYSHADERWSRWLQRSLERYRIPAKLRLQQPVGNTLPRRLHPIFRDRDELASSSDLSESIRSALDQSSALIVICSPNAARSKWVNEEVRYFQSLGRSDRIFCLLISGSPDRTSPDCAFPLALLHTESDQPLPDPLAADISVEADGKRSALLKIVAGLLGVGIDDLKQRDAQRRLRVRGAFSVASLLIAVITVGFAVTAHLARSESELRRTQAEGLISFMLGDLREKLEPVGRLDLLDAVGNEAMDYFAMLGDRGTAQEVYARAMALRQIGEVRFRQGHLAEAQKAFEESRDVAEALFASKPLNNEYLFELGQAEFWVGYTAFEQSNLELTELSMTKYMEYSRKLLSLEPLNSNYQLELSYAYSNLGTLLLEKNEPERALTHFRQSTSLDENLVAADPDNLELKHQLGNGYSWVGFTQLELGRLAGAKLAYRAAFESLSDLHDTGENRLFTEHYGQNAYHLGNVHMNQGEIAAAEGLFKTALDVFNELTSFDPDNAIWRSDRAISAYHQAWLFMLTDRRTEARGLLERAIIDLETLVAKDPGDLRAVENLALAERLMALLALDKSIDQSLTLSTRAQTRVTQALNSETLKTRTALNAAIIAETHGRVLRESGDEPAAISTWKTALELLNGRTRANLTQIAVESSLTGHLQGHSAVVGQFNQLEDAGFFDPRYR